MRGLYSELGDVARAEILRRNPRGVEAAHPVDAGAGVRVARAEVEPLHRHPISEVWKHGAKEELLVPRPRAAPALPAAQIRLHSLPALPRHDPPSHNPLA